MANKSKKQVKEELVKLGIPVVTDNYQELCGLLKDATKVDDSPEEGITISLPESDAPEETSSVVTIVNRIKMRNVFLADSVRNERDATFLNAELRKRIYKGKVDKIVTIKHYDRNDEGEFVTEFDIVLKD